MVTSRTRGTRFKSSMENLLLLMLSIIKKVGLYWAVVVAQLVERLLPTPEVHGSNPVIGKIYIEHFLLSTVYKRQK